MKDYATSTADIVKDQSQRKPTRTKILGLIR